MLAMVLALLEVRAPYGLVANSGRLGRCGLV